MEPPQFRVLGPVEVAGGDGPIDLGSPRQQTVLALLLAHPNRVVSTDRLILEVWGETASDKAKHSLQTYISNLRRVLGGVIETRRPGYLIHIDPHQLDSLAFEQAGPEDALKLWRGEPFAGLTDASPMLQAEAGRLSELRLSLLEARLEENLAAGQHDTIVGELEQLTVQYPLRERFWSFLMLALYRSGRQSEALRAYRDARKTLGEQLGIEPSLELQELEERILLHDRELTWEPERGPQHNLPTQISSFVGRESQLIEVSKLLEESRLVTVTGPGGSGKTRLALEVAQSLLDRFRDGVWLIPLAALSDGALIATEMLGFIGLDSPVQRDHLEALTDQLAERESLLIIDNCEHVLQEAAQVVNRVLRADPQVKVLTTSRELLGVTGEVAWPIPPMELPEDDMNSSEVASAEAVRLFAERAMAVDLKFAIDDTNAQTVASICRRLDGLPLAIELAAARTRAFHIGEIDRRLQDRFALLTGGDPTALQRHQTLLGTVEWSYELMNPPQQELYQRLSVFAGGFTLEAAESVGASEGIPSSQVADLLSDLVTQSLVAAEQTTFGARYRMLETIRVHGLAKQDETNRAGSAFSALMKWAGQVADEASQRLEGPDQAEGIGRLQIEHDNIRTSLAWALDNDPGAGLAVIIPMTQFWWIDPGFDRHGYEKSTSHLRAGAEWARQMLEAAGDSPPVELRAGALIAHGLLQIRLGGFEGATASLEEAENLIRPVGNPLMEGRAALYRGVSSWSMVPWSETILLFERALELSTEAGHQQGVLFATLMMGWSLVLSGTDVERGLGFVGRFDSAAQQTQIPNLLAHAADTKALFDLVLDRDRDQVPGLLAEAIREFRSIGHPGCMTHALHAVALHHAKQGDMERAAHVLGCAEAVTDRLAIVVAPYEDRSHLVEEAGLDAMDPDERQAAIEAGKRATYEEALDYALEGLG